MKKYPAIFSFLFLASVIALPLFPRWSQASEWKQYGGNVAGHMHQTEEYVIDVGNVGSLIPDPSISSIFDGIATMVGKQPAFDDAGYMYLAPLAPDFSLGRYVKMRQDGSTDPENWDLTGSQVASDCGLPVDSVIALQTPALAGDKVIFSTLSPGASGAYGLDADDAIYVVALDKADGSCAWATNVETAVAITADTSPLFAENTVYVATSSVQEEAAANPGFSCCTLNGSVIALDAQTGAIKWQTYMIDEAGDPDDPSDDLPAGSFDGYSGMTIWGSPMAFDAKRKSVYFSTGNAYSRGPNIEPDDPRITPFHLAINSIVSLDSATGNKKWVYTAIPGDYWNVACLDWFTGGPDDNCPEEEGPDYDFGSGVLLMKNIKVNETNTDLVTSQSKSGEQITVNAETGELVWRTRTAPPTLMGLNGQAFDGIRLYATSANAIGAAGNASSFHGVAWNLVGGPNAGTTVYGGLVTALNPATGAIIWQNAGPASMLAPEFSGIISQAPVLADAFSANGVVYTSVAFPNIFGGLFNFGPEGTLWAFNGETGELLLDKSVGPSFATPIVNNGHLYVGTVLGGLQGFSLP